MYEIIFILSIYNKIDKIIKDLIILNRINKYQSWISHFVY